MTGKTTWSAARDNASFILERMTPDGRLRRTDGDSQNGAQGFLDDYSHLIDGLLALHAADGDLRWLIEAEKLTRQAVALFWDPLQKPLLRHRLRPGEPDYSTPRRHGQRPALRPLHDDRRPHPTLHHHRRRRPQDRWPPTRSGESATS